MNAALRAGAAYFAIIFALGFVLGTIRVLLLTPAVGPTVAVLLELPVVLFASWQVCASLMRRYEVPNSTTARAAMGAFAFALLMLIEFTLATLVFRQSADAYLQGFREMHAVLGLLGQIGFALMPWLQQDGRRE